MASILMRLRAGICKCHASATGSVDILNRNNMGRFGLSLVVCMATVTVGFAQTSSQGVLLAYLKALRSQDLETVTNLSIVDTAPFLLGYEIVDWRSVESETVDLEALEKRGEALTTRIQELESELLAEKNRIQPTLQHVDDELKRVRKENDGIIIKLNEGTLTKAEYRREQKALEYERKDLLGRKKEINAGLRPFRAAVREAQLEKKALRMEILNLKAHYGLLLLRGFDAFSSEKAMQTNRFSFHKREAIVDLQIQSKAGFRLFKKHSIVLKRPIVGGSRGRWLVAELNDLSE